MFSGKQKGRKLISEDDDGKGTLALADGSQYTGELKGGLAHGEGTITFSDGRELTGSFKHGNPHGENLVLTFPDGRKYVGEYSYGRRHGWGTMFFPDGKKFEGEWKNDQPQGEGTITYPDGTIEKGKWIKGAKISPKDQDEPQSGSTQKNYLIPVLLIVGVLIYVVWFI